MELLLTCVVGVVAPAIVAFLLRSRFSVPGYMMALLFFAPNILAVLAFQGWLSFTTGGHAMGLDLFVYPIALILFGPWSLALSTAFWVLGNRTRVAALPPSSRLMLFAGGGTLVAFVPYLTLSGIMLLLVKGAHSPATTQGVAGVLAFLVDGLTSGLIIAACLQRDEPVSKAGAVSAQGI